MGGIEETEGGIEKNKNYCNRREREEKEADMKRKS